MKSGIAAWGVCRNTFRESAVVEGMLAIVAKAGAPRGASIGAVALRAVHGGQPLASVPIARIPG